MRTVYLSCYDIEESQCLKLNCDELSFEIVQDEDFIYSGNGIKIYLPVENKYEFVALYARENSYYLVFDHMQYDLSRRGLSSKIVDGLFTRKFSFSLDGEVFLSFKYKHKDRENDVLEDVCDILNSKFKDMLISHSIKFFTSESLGERAEVDRCNAIELFEARKKGAGVN